MRCRKAWPWKNTVSPRLEASASDDGIQGPWVYGSMPYRVLPKALDTTTVRHAEKMWAVLLIRVDGEIPFSGCVIGVV